MAYSDDKKNRLSKADKDEEGCTWGFFNDANAGDDLQEGSDESKFIIVYEEYLKNNNSPPDATQNESSYCQNPQKSLEDWFSNEGHDFEPKVVQQEEEFICHIDIPLDNQDFEIQSDAKAKRKDAIFNVCLKACKLLDAANILYPWQQSKDPDGRLKRKQIAESQYEDDIEYDDTIQANLKHAKKKIYKAADSQPQIDTYDSLMAKWNNIMLSLSKSKAQLVSIDLSVHTQASKVDRTKEKCPDEDPLDTYMNTLNEKPKLSINDKIQKSKLKNQISQLEKEKSALEKLIEIAKPKFNLNKACPIPETNKNLSSLSSASLMKLNQSCDKEPPKSVRVMCPSRPAVGETTLSKD